MTAVFEEFERYAIYFAPKARSALAHFGNHWLGRDPETGALLLRPDLSGLQAQQLLAWTKSPSRYGFHGTLKPPFFLKEGRDFADLDRAVTALAAKQKAFSLGSLTVKQIGRFLALCPKEQSEELRALASTCVKELDDFRKPASSDELARRRAKGLTNRQENYLQDYGYPYVHEEFRFHLTLSDALEETALSKLNTTLETVTKDAVQEPVMVDEICLFGDPGNNGPFRLLKRYGFG